MVNYLNSKPFELGLSNTPDGQLFDIIMANPALCAEAYRKGEADIALIPVGGLKDLEDYEIVTDYCIACDGEVRTVCLFSNDEITDCHKLFLDDHSKTSYLLSKVLTHQYWNLDLSFEKYTVSNIELHKGEAVLMIGDKVFEYENQFKFKYDLGSVWKQWTGKPFVFAVWIARKGTPKDVIQKLNRCLSYGIQHIDQIIQRESSEHLDLFYYFTHNIKYHFDATKKEALSLFFEKVESNLLLKHSK